MKKILFIVGSLRKDSFNRQLAREAEQMIGTRAEVNYLDYKKVALSGAGGKMATAKCREKLTELLTFIKADVMEQQTGIVLKTEAWTEGRMILSDDQRQALKAQVEALLRIV